MLSPTSLMTCRILRYSGRKSCPHSEIQCASSTATKDTVILRRNATLSSLAKDCGTTYISLVVPFFTSCFTRRISFLVNEEFRKFALLSRQSKALCWSTLFFRETVNREITKVV